MMKRLIARFRAIAASVAARLFHSGVFGVVIARWAVRRLRLVDHERQAGCAGPESSE
jgi:hypothetical protein